MKRIYVKPEGLGTILSKTDTQVEVRFDASIDDLSYVFTRKDWDAKNAMNATPIDYIVEKALRDARINKK